MEQESYIDYNNGRFATVAKQEDGSAVVHIEYFDKEKRYASVHDAVRDLTDCGFTIDAA